MRPIDRLKSLIETLRQVLSFARRNGDVQEPSEEERSSGASGESRLDNIIYVDQWRETPSKPSEERRSHKAPRWKVATIACMMAIVAGVFATRAMNPASTDGMIATAAGESQTTTFHDGGGVSVKPNSRVLLDAYESERRVELLKGEAVFTATPVPNRPLVVSTYIARASAVDATFRVALDGGMLVEVYDGQVDVAVPGRSAITLRKGNRYRVIEELSDSVVAQERGQEQEVVLGSMTRAKS